jgi:7-alpha-hydroxysteroid dehydrogenase
MDGHVAIVTGGAQNIGEGVARTFSGAGAKVMIADLNGEKAKRPPRRSLERDRQRTCIGIGCNVTVEADIQAWSPRPSRRSAASPRW